MRWRVIRLSRKCMAGTWQRLSISKRPPDIMNVCLVPRTRFSDQVGSLSLSIRACRRRSRVVPAYQGSNDVSDIFSMWALRQAVENLPRIAKDGDDKEAKRHMLYVPLAPREERCSDRQFGLYLCGNWIWQCRRPSLPWHELPRKLTLCLRQPP